MASIIGTGAVFPITVVDNIELEARVSGVDAAWVEKTLGISSRRIMPGDFPGRRMAQGAAESALKNAGIEAADLDLIIVGTTKADRIAPASACYLQAAIGASCPAFDLTSVCASFTFAMINGIEHINAKACDKVLIVGVDALSRITDWTDRDCVFFGDGGAAVVLAPGEGILSYHWGTEGQVAEAWTVEEEPALHWRMDGKAVFDLAVDYMSRSIKAALKATDLTVEDVNVVIPHQPSIQILKKVAEAIEVPFEKFFINMNRFANTASAAVPMALHQAVHEKFIKKDDIVVLASVGAGWSWGSIVLRWSR